MRHLDLCLFGSPTLTLDGQIIIVDRCKAVALLAYLALEPRPHRRDALATLFWPELSQAQARSGLRRVLNTLKNTIGLDWFQITRETVQIEKQGELDVDIWRFRELLAHGPSGAHPSAHLQQAIALYRDDLLSGFSLRDAPAFEEWRYFAAEALRQQVTDALKMLLQLQVSAGAINDALNTAHRWLALDALQEEAHQTLITLHLATGDRSAALRQYEHCVQLLDQELGVPPSPATRALFDAIRTQPGPAISLPLGAEPASETISTADKPRVVDEIRQVVALDLAILDYSEERRTSARTQQLTHFRTTALATLQRFTAHIERLDANGVAALFGVPYSHEDDAERAVSAAIALRQIALQVDLPIAAGIQIGLAQVERSEQRDSATSGVIYSAALGQAAELQRAAAPGQIMVAYAVYLRTHAAFDYTDVPITLRGRPQPMIGYLAMQAKPALAKTRGIPGLSSELIGREAELAVMESAVQQLTAGVGRALLLTGEAGIGKSRLVRELWKRRPQQCLWLEGVCLEMTTPISYWPFHQALRGYFGWQANDDERTQAHSIRAGLEKLAAAHLLNEESSAEIGAILGELTSVRFDYNWRLSRERRLEDQHKVAGAA